MKTDQTRRYILSLAYFIVELVVVTQLNRYFSIRGNHSGQAPMKQKLETRRFGLFQIYSTCLCRIIMMQYWRQLAECAFTFPQYKINPLLQSSLYKRQQWIFLLLIERFLFVSIFGMVKK